MAAPVIGLTGGIGSGKSTVAALLAERGARVIDTDRVGHEVYLPGTEGFRRVVEAFGPGVVAADGSIDRAALGAIVFRDPAALRRLNGIVHPLIGAETARRVAALRTEGFAGPIVLEIPLLVEAGWRGIVDRVWVVAVSRETAVARASARSNLPRAEVERRIDAQIPDAERRRHADLVIENDGSPADLRARVEEAWRTLGS
jgi:dephospho-CoA kinase